MKNIVSIIALAALANVALAIPPVDPARLDQVEQRGSQVMPFALDKTLHVFTQSPSGGVQQVLAKDAGDAEQIGLIRQHLIHLAAGFDRGDFSGPRRIHGDDMTGVQALSAAAGKVVYQYRELPNGAEIEYQTADPVLVEAIHQYFEAQLSDHARHAMPGGHVQHHDHPRQ